MKKVLLLLLIAFIIVSAKKIKKDNKEADDRVTVNLYYESLCPGCQNFIRYTLTPALEVEGFLQIAKIKMIPYGNAKTYDDGYIDCQHGDNECYGNILGACSFKHVQKSLRVNFIVCLENNIEDRADNFDDVSKFCYEKYSVPTQVQKKVSECWQGDEGQELLYNAGQETIALYPNKKFVPWLVINGEQTEEIQDQAQDDLVAYVCKVYKGKVKLEGCAKYTQTQQAETPQIQNTQVTQ